MAEGTSSMDVIMTIVAIFALINCYLVAMIFYLVKDIYNEITKGRGFDDHTISFHTGADGVWRTARVHCSTQ